MLVASTRSGSKAADNVQNEARVLGRSIGAEPLVIYPDISLDLTGFFPGKHLFQFLANKMQDFGNLVLHDCIFNFDAEQVNFKSQVTNVKNKEVTANPKPQTLETNWSFENPKP